MRQYKFLCSHCLKKPVSSFWLPEYSIQYLSQHGGTNVLSVAIDSGAWTFWRWQGAEGRAVPYWLTMTCLATSTHTEVSEDAKGAVRYGPPLCTAYAVCLLTSYGTWRNWSLLGKRFCRYGMPHRIYPAPSLSWLHHACNRHRGRAWCGSLYKTAWQYAHHG